MIDKIFLNRCLIVAAVVGVTPVCFGQRVQRLQRDLFWAYHPNHPGVQAFMQGGAYVATTGSAMSMLFNPAGLAELPSQLMVHAESGWSSEGDYAPAYDLDASSQFLPLQFVGVTWKAKDKLSIGAFYSRPTDYRLEIDSIPFVTGQNPEPREFLTFSVTREQTSFGLVLARTVSKQFVVGAGLEWRRATVRDQLRSTVYEGNADALRFSLGMILQVHDWNLGIAAQSRYKASGHTKYQPQRPLVVAVFPVDWYEGNDRLPSLEPDAFPFSSIEPSTFRFGIKTPFLDRIRFNVDVEYKDFEDDDLIEPWQFYGGANLRLTSHAQLSLGAFTFSNEYRKFIDGPSSETFLTVGGEIELSPIRFSVNFIDGDLLADDFAGQQFVNVAVGYVLH